MTDKEQINLLLEQNRILQEQVEASNKHIFALMKCLENAQQAQKDYLQIIDKLMRDRKC